MRTHFLFRAGILIVLAVAATGTARAQSAQPESVDAKVMSSAAFLDAHPDLNYRMLGLKAWREQKYDKAMRYFRRAARYADKPSQAMVAELYWRGQGVAVDRPQAYAWMDLAAERQFKVMLAHREQYWESMSATEREQALIVGKAIYAEYGDTVAKPRLEHQMRIARTSSVGSRTGFVGNSRVIIPGQFGDETVLDGSQFYQDKFWKPEAYWAWQAKDWKEFPKGRVEVAPLRDAVLK